MNPDIFESISSQYFQLTNSEKKVADYILSHRIDAQYMSISELAEECEVADATISRFCRRLGLGGYNAFKLELAKASLPTRPVVAPKAPPRAEGDFHELSHRRLHENVSALEQTLKRLDPAAVDRAVEWMLEAERVFCMGQGSSMVMAEEAWTMFSTVSPSFQFVPDSHLQITTAARMKPGDVILFFSYSGSTRELQDILEVAHGNQAQVILVTRFPKSPGGQQADLVLQCGSNEGPLQSGSATARIAQLFVLDLLFAALCQQQPNQVTDSQERIAEAVARMHL